jgi:hypothetical protein
MHYSPFDPRKFPLALFSKEGNRKADFFEWRTRDFLYTSLFCNLPPLKKGDQGGFRTAQGNSGDR